MDLACVHLMPQPSRTHQNSSCRTYLNRSTVHIQRQAISTVRATLRLLTKSIRSAMRSTTVSSSTLPRHTTSIWLPPWPAILTPVHPFPHTSQPYSRAVTFTSHLRNGHANGMKPILHSSAPPVGLLCPYPFGHIHRGLNYGGPYPRTVDLAQMDPNVFHEWLALQMHHYVLNNGGTVSDSTLSPLSMPFLGLQ